MQGRKQHWKAIVVLVTTAVLILGIPSLPRHQDHIFFWMAAFVFDCVFIAVLWPLHRA
jgi:hypothetical protein